MPLIDSAQWWEHLKKKVPLFFLSLHSLRSHSLNAWRSVCVCVSMWNVSAHCHHHLSTSMNACTLLIRVVDAEIDCRYNLIVCHARALRVHTESKSHKRKSGQLSLNVESSRLTVARCEISNANFDWYECAQTAAATRALLAMRWRAPQTWKPNNVIYCIIMVASLISHANCQQNSSWQKKISRISYAKWE